MQKDLFAVGEPISQKLPRKHYKTDWVEDIHAPAPSPESYLSSHFESKKLQWVLLAIIFIFGTIVARVGYLQIIKGNEYRLIAEENRIRIQEIKAPRGVIYDRNGTRLVHNVPNFFLSSAPADLPKDEKERGAVIEKIANILSLSILDVRQAIEQYPSDSYQSFILYDQIPYAQAVLLKIASAELPGISLGVTTSREYLVGSHFSHLLGYTGKISESELAAHPEYAYDDYLGKSGVELFYDGILRGTNGRKEIEVNSLGKESKIIAESRATAGKSIILTIDKNLQELLGQSLDEVVARSKSITGAAAVAIDPNNGEVLALASSPGFDNNAFTKGLTADEYQKIVNDPKKPFIDRAVAGEYPSGSTIKPLIALAALQERIINKKTTYLSTGGLRIDKWFFPDWKAGGHGETNVIKAIAESINTFFYIIGGGYEKVTGLGVERIKSYLERFGLGSPLGIDVPGEASGFLPSQAWKEETKGEQWYIGDTYHLAIGQGDLLVTPLQVATYTATVANGGTFYKPHLVKAFSDTEYQNAQPLQPEIVRQDFIDQPYYEIVKEGLRQAVLTGSAGSLADLPVAVAAKTGTAQFGNQGATHAWLTAFAPYDHPQIAITVLVEGGGEGHLTALPIAKKALSYWFSAAK